MSEVTSIPAGVVHDLPRDLEDALRDNEQAMATWHDITPLARNEWICWMISPKKQETRDEHFARLQEDVLAGKKRPCCWPGCPHRRASAQKYFKS